MKLVPQIIHFKSYLDSGTITVCQKKNEFTVFLDVENGDKLESFVLVDDNSWNAVNNFDPSKKIKVFRSYEDASGDVDNWNEPPVLN